MGSRLGRFGMIISYREGLWAFHCQGGCVCKGFPRRLINGGAATARSLAVRSRSYTAFRAAKLFWPRSIIGAWLDGFGRRVDGPPLGRFETAGALELGACRYES